MKKLLVIFLAVIVLFIGGIIYLLQVSGNISYNQSQINVHQAQIAGIGVPQNLIEQYAPGLNTLVEEVIKDRSPSYSIETLEVTEGKVRFKGTSPDREQAVSAN